MTSDGPSSASRWARFARSASTALPLLLVISLLVHFLHDGIWLFPFESAQLDAWLLLREPRTSQDIILVTIDDDDYERLFGGTSPLNTRQLGNVIDAIVAGRPRAVGIDIDTSAQAFGRPNAVPTGPTIVWAEDGRLSGDTVLPIPARGGAAAARESGIALFPLDRDGVVRRYQRCFKTPGGARPAFALRLVGAARQGSAACGPKSSADEVILDFAGDRRSFPRISASSVLAGAQGRLWGTQSPIRGKIILLGGVYSAARDTYVTPLGLMAGVELAAAATESEMRGGGIRVLHRIVLTGAELLIGVLLVAVHSLLRPGIALALSLVALLAGPLLASWLAFTTLAYWVNAVPPLFAVLLHQLYEQSRRRGGSEANIAPAVGRAVAQTNPLDAGRLKHKRGVSPAGLAAIAVVWWLVNWLSRRQAEPPLGRPRSRSPRITDE